MLCDDVPWHDFRDSVLMSIEGVLEQGFATQKVDTVLDRRTIAALGVSIAP
jgi:hypothetical protein